jgi:hypothetical protein
MIVWRGRGKGWVKRKTTIKKPFQYNRKLTAWSKGLLKLRDSPLLMKPAGSLLSSQELLTGFLSQMNTHHICTPILCDTF